MSDLDKTLQALTYYKQAASSPSFREALQNYYSQGLRAAALHRALGIGAAGLGVGLGARGLLGLLNLGKGNIAPEEPYASSLVDLGEEKEEKEAGVPKGGLSFSASRLTSDEFEAKHKKEKKKRKRKSRYKKANILDFLKGEYAETTKGVPWAIPAAVGAGAGGLYGGWKLMDYVLDQRRKQNLDEELETAKAEYEAALSGADKDAADGSLAADLDQLYDNISEYGEKAAASWPELGGQAAGVYGAGAGVGALVMALLGYKQGRKKQRRRILARAQARKRREEYQRRPDPLYVRAGRSSELAPTVEDESSDASPSLDEIEDQLL